MPTNEIQSDAYADLGQAWFRDQFARLMQKHLQFGRHYRMDVDDLLARSAHAARAARATTLPAENHSQGTDRVLRAMIESIEHCSPLEDPRAQIPRPPLSTESGPQLTSAKGSHSDAELTTLGKLSLIKRLGATPCDEWTAVLSDFTEIVITDVRGRPSSLGIAKAVSIVQSRTYLEAHARQLLNGLTNDDGDWHLMVIDFGVEARRHNCEFLMCFAFQAANSDLSATGPYAEIGFALLKQSSAAPILPSMRPRAPEGRAVSIPSRGATAILACVLAYL